VLFHLPIHSSHPCPEFDFFRDVLGAQEEFCLPLVFFFFPAEALSPRRARHSKRPNTSLSTLQTIFVRNAIPSRPVIEHNSCAHGKVQSHLFPPFLLLIHRQLNSPPHLAYQNRRFLGPLLFRTGPPLWLSPHNVLYLPLLRVIETSVRSQIFPPLYLTPISVLSPLDFYQENGWQMKARGACCLLCSLSGEYFQGPTRLLKRMHSSDPWTSPIPGSVPNVFSPLLPQGPPLILFGGAQSRFFRNLRSLPMERFYPYSFPFPEIIFFRRTLLLPKKFFSHRKKWSVVLITIPFSFFYFSLRLSLR